MTSIGTGVSIFGLILTYVKEVFTSIFYYLNNSTIYPLLNFRQMEEYFKLNMQIKQWKLVGK
jgi:hypothetical protein